MTQNIKFSLDYHKFLTIPIWSENKQISFTQGRL